MLMLDHAKFCGNLRRTTSCITHLQWKTIFCILKSVVQQTYGTLSSEDYHATSLLFL